MQKSPLVSIICLCYNHEKFVIEALNSVINQSYKNIELIIADDFSNDASEKVIENWIENYPNIIFIANESNLGNTKTFNTALQFAKGDYIIDLAADDILLPDCVEKQINTFLKSEQKKLGIVYGNAEIISENNTHIRYYYKADTDKKALIKPASGDIYLAMLNQSSMICSVSSMVKKDVLEQLNGYDENLAYEDLDLWIRTSRNYNFEFIDAVLVQKRELENSLGNQFYKKFNSRTRKINHSSYLVIKKAIALNKTKNENKALLKRLHYEMTKAYKTFDLLLLLKYIPLEIKLRLF
ncbi:glycosyltransferase family 2 protein [Flavobacterium sp. ANB]|uniref:glycosyltransferase family 2 protein n=1 Tax=unclassified Flavobacterium TaxID=196869 RepID=UPI0012B7F2B1|nr:MULTISPECIES: glycosyltransferase family A protein [unclassified Flavobacterium]MBF4516290.1 glycosyltransferase family 2 protein [Flavobacterium sp. ANB]MTD69813.1 glycosyltransferase [Flavobacterium sp. LC2016-13]